MPRTPWTLLRRVFVTLIAFASVAIDFHGNPNEYFSYFTALTNLGIGLWFLVSLWQPACDRASELRLRLTIYGLVTLTVYWLLLSPTHHPQGWKFVANLGLHLVVPLAMAIEDIVKPWPPLRLGRLEPDRTGGLGRAQRGSSGVADRIRSAGARLARLGSPPG